MKPLFVLMVTFLLTLIALKFIKDDWNFKLAGTIAMSAMLIFTSVGHFAFSKGMTMMVPSFVPFKKQIVFATGVFEILAAIALLLPGWRHVTGISLVIFFILMLPANINAAGSGFHCKFYLSHGHIGLLIAINLRGINVTLAGEMISTAN